jgi:hypothetical protein
MAGRFYPLLHGVKTGPGRRTVNGDGWRPGWSRYFSGKKLIAGRLDLKPGIVQPLNDDLGRVFGVEDLRRP